MTPDASRPDQTNGQLRPASEVIGKLRAATQELRQMESVLMERTRFGETASRAGYAFPDATTGLNKRDLFKELGFPRTLSIADYRDRYRRGGIAKRIVNAPVKATWSGNIALQDDPDPEIESAFETAAAELAMRLGLWPRLMRADILASLGRYSVLLIGAPGEMNTELTSVRNPDEILYLTPLAEDNAEILRLVDDSTDPRFGQPLMYQISLGGEGARGRGSRVSGRDLQRKVHYSRIIHIAQGLLEDDVYGTPALEAVWNDLDNLVKLVGGGSEAAWKRADPGMHLNFPLLDLEDAHGVEIQYDEEEEEKVLEELSEFRHGMSRVLSTRGVDIKMLDGGVVNFAGMASAVLDLISATVEQPKRILLGSERGELASTQDRSNWADRIIERRGESGEPAARAVIDRFIELRALPEPIESQYKILWPDIDKMTEEEKADLGVKVASANKAQVDASDTPVMTSEEMRDSIWGLEPLEDAGGKTEETAALRAAAVAFEERDQVQAAAKKSVGPIANVVTELWAASGNWIGLDELEEALGGSASAAEKVVESGLVAAESEIFPAVQSAILGAMVAGGEAAAAATTRRGAWTATNLRSAADGFEVSFDTANPSAVAWAERAAAEMVVEIGAATREAIKELIVKGISEGIPPRALARQIREVVGLLNRQVTAIANLKNELNLAEPGALIERFPAAEGLRGQAGFRVRVPPKGLSEAEIEKLTARYSRMQLNLRARTIARTESLMSSNEGQRRLWLQAQESGQLARKQTRMWIATADSRTREEHANMHGEVVGINEDYSIGIEPGQAANCRCGQALGSAEDGEKLKTDFQEART